jgi:tetratricopeptide (TPR) repeat protein
MGRLADEQRRLDELKVGDQEVRASIHLSYMLLPDLARAALRRLGMLGLPYFPAWVAAAALDTNLDAAERVLEDLVDQSLVEVDGVDPVGLIRYRLHDLVSLFAQERARHEELPENRIGAVQRVLGGWLWLIEQINKTVPPVLPTIHAVVRTGWAVDPKVTRTVVARPYDWFRGEEEALTAAVERAASLGLDGVAVELASALSSTAFDGQLHVLDDPYGPWRRTHDAALIAARRNGNALGEATLLVGLGQLCYELDEYARSRAHLDQALSIFRAEGDIRGEATALAALGATCREQGHLAEALRYLDQAAPLWATQAAPGAMGHVHRLAGTIRVEMGDYSAAHADLTTARALFASAGSLRSEGLTLRSLALYHRARGELAHAEDLARSALAICHQTEDRLMVAYAERTLAKTLLRLDDTTTALRLAENALATCRLLGDGFGQACTLRVIGEIHLATGRWHQARECLEKSLRQWTDLHSELFRARTMYTLAEVHAALGNTDTARQMATEAIETFRIHGAREYTELTTGHRKFAVIAPRADLKGDQSPLA